MFIDKVTDCEFTTCETLQLELCVYKFLVLLLSKKRKVFFLQQFECTKTQNFVQMKLAPLKFVFWVRSRKW